MRKGGSWVESCGVDWSHVELLYLSSLTPNLSGIWEDDNLRSQCLDCEQP